MLDGTELNRTEPAAMPDIALRHITDFDQLRDYLEAELDWHLAGYEFQDLVFDYEPEELGLKKEDAAKVRSIHQLRPLTGEQPWGIFFVEFERKKIPVVVLRRILSSLAIRKRASANQADRVAFAPDDLLFVTRFGTDDDPEIAFAHFHQENDRTLPVLRVLGWDGSDTPLKLDRVADTLKNRLSWPEDDTDHDAWREQWAGAFRHRIGHVIKTSDLLADALADLARSIRSAALQLMERETEKGPLRTLHQAFQEALIHDLDEKGFADTYAQTITYGLLSAAISRTELSEGRYGTYLSAVHVADMIPVTSPFLKEMLHTFLEVGGQKRGLDFDELGVQDVVDLLSGDETDLPAVLADFGNKKRDEDPVIHFYEHFLKAYDKDLWKGRGVIYTPRPVVSYIVRSVDELLKTEFGLEHGLADTTTWAEFAAAHPDASIPKGTDPDSFFVNILDPATGTAAFPVEVIDVVHRHLERLWKKSGASSMPTIPLPEDEKPQAGCFVDWWNQYVAFALLPRLHGYELLMAPYAIAHMKIGLKLTETGYRFGSDQRALIFLTNALEPAHDHSDRFAFDIPALAHEAGAVSEIKRSKRFTVVIGNPPYAVTSANFNTFIDSLMNDYKKHVRGEQGLVALADDYLKFIRLSQKLLEPLDCGVWAMITNHGYLKGVIHRGVRKELIDQFNEMFILDLHGDSNIGERVPAGQANENVFDIQQGVAVSIAVRSVGKASASLVRHCELWGSRTEKYEDLESHPISLRKWTTLQPNEPRYFLVPFDDANLAEFEDFPSLKMLMEVNSCGVKTHRDAVVIDYDKKTLIERMSDIASEHRLELLRERYGITDTPNWTLKDAQLKIVTVEVPQYIQRLTYRPFDNRWIYYNPAIIEKGDSKYPTLRHMLHRNVALLSARIQATGVFDAVFASKFLAEMKTAESSRSCTVFPLFLTDDDDSPQAELSYDGVRPNLDAKILSSWAQKLGLKTKGNFGLPTGVTPEDIFHYSYAVFHSPGYRSRYAEFLKIDFPRLPLTGNLELFRALARLGGELTALHLLESPTLDEPITEFIGDDRQVSKVIYTKDGGGTVWIDGKGTAKNPQPGTSGFRPVPEELWNFHIGGYQVCEKWLKDRGPKRGQPGRTLTDDDIAHYHKIVIALTETIRLMAEIDEVIETHGGWPDAFAVPDSDEASTEEETASSSSSRAATGSTSPTPAPIPKPEPTESPDDPSEGRSENFTSIDTLDRNELVAHLRDALIEQGSLDRDTLLREAAYALGYQRLGKHIAATLDNALRTAHRRGVVLEQDGRYRVDHLTLSDWDRDFLKTQLLASLSDHGRVWIERDEAIRHFARWLGYRRTGPVIEETGRSLINGLIRESRIEKDGSDWIRRA